MGHYAKVVGGVVDRVIVAEADFFDTFVDDSPGEWVQTSYNTRLGVHYDPETGEPSADQSKALRKNFAGVGFLYDGTGFYQVKPYDSWTFNSTTYSWDAPVDYPSGDGVYEWNEETQTWDEVS